MQVHVYLISYGVLKVIHSMYTVAHIHRIVVSCAVVIHIKKACLSSSTGSEMQAGIYLLRHCSAS